MLITLIALFAALVASVITWLLCGVRLRQTIPLQEYATLQQQCIQFQTSEAVLRGLFTDVQQSRDTAEARLQSATVRIEELGTKAAATDTRCLSLLESN